MSRASRRALVALALLAVGGGGVGCGAKAPDRQAPPPLQTPSKAEMASSAPAATSTSACPADMVHVPAGSFMMGSPDGTGNQEEHPQHKVTLSGFCVDKTEVTVAAYAACATKGGCKAAPLEDNLGTHAERKLRSQFCNGNRNDRQNHPVNCVDWNAAKTYCEWAGKRLPTEAEWEYAARGNDGRTYPWGNDKPVSNRLNWNKEHEGTMPVGSFPDGASPFGALDMAGNVWEWTADGFYYYLAIDETNPTDDDHADHEGEDGPNPLPGGASSNNNRVYRGGGWAENGADLVRAADREYRSDPGDRGNDLGFRCARGN